MNKIFRIEIENRSVAEERVWETTAFSNIGLLFNKVSQIKKLRGARKKKLKKTNINRTNFF